MEPLVRASLALRALLRRTQGLLVAGALAAYVVRGGAREAFGPLQGIAVAMWGCWAIEGSFGMVGSIGARVRGSQDEVERGK